MFWLRKKKHIASPGQKDDIKEKAVQRNKDAARRLERALEKLSPVKDLSDLLGGEL